MQVKRAEDQDRRKRIEEQNRNDISLTSHLMKEEDFPTWPDNLISALKRADLHDHILREVPEPADNAEKEKWKKDRAAVDNCIQKTVPHQVVWTTLKTMGWDITEQNPKSTLDKLTQYFDDEDSHEANYSLCRELFTIKRENYNKFSAFQHRLNYFRQRLDQTKG